MRQSADSATHTVQMSLREEYRSQAKIFNQSPLNQAKDARPSAKSPVRNIILPRLVKPDLPTYRIKSQQIVMALLSDTGAGSDPLPLAWHSPSNQRASPIHCNEAKVITPDTSIAIERTIASPTCCLGDFFFALAGNSIPPVHKAQSTNAPRAQPSKTSWGKWAARFRGKALFMKMMKTAAAYAQGRFTSDAAKPHRLAAIWAALWGMPKEVSGAKAFRCVLSQ